MWHRNLPQTADADVRRRGDAAAGGGGQLDERLVETAEFVARAVIDSGGAGRSRTSPSPIAGNEPDSAGPDADAFDGDRAGRIERANGLGTEDGHEQLGGRHDDAHDSEVIPTATGLTAGREQQPKDGRAVPVDARLGQAGDLEEHRSGRERRLDRNGWVLRWASSLRRVGSVVMSRRVGRIIRRQAETSPSSSRTPR